MKHPPPLQAKAGKQRRAILGWMFFDWASQPFHTLVLTFIFAPYFAAQVAADPAAGQAAWGWAISAGALAVAFLAPVLGAIADAGGSRRPWIIGFSALFVIGVIPLWLAEPGTPNLLPILACLCMALIGVEFLAVFTNALLPTLGSKSEIGRISGSGWAMGYWGGLASLAIVLCLLTPAPGSKLTLIGIEPVLGLDPATGGGARATGPMAALWYLAFMIPFFLWTPDSPRRRIRDGAVKAGLTHLLNSLKRLPGRRSLSAFLLSSMLYRDALAGLFIFGGIYAAGVLGWQIFQLGVFGIVGALAGAVGAWIGGLQDSRHGPRPVIRVTILALAVTSAVLISTSREAVLFLPVGAPGAPSVLPDALFYLCGAVIGAAGGALQASSRSMLIRQSDEDASAEAFGLYALAGKATAFLAPFLIALATDLSGSQRIGALPVLLLFGASLLLLPLVSDGADPERLPDRARAA